MLVNCPICSEILLPSDVLYSTPCGHIFHVTCLNRWLAWWDFFWFSLSLFMKNLRPKFLTYDIFFRSSNNTCPQCRSESSLSTIHRIYLPEVNYQDQDSLIERMNDINRQKIESDNKLKKIEQEKKALENDLKKKKKEFHKVVQRSRNIAKSK